MYTYEKGQKNKVKVTITVSKEDWDKAVETSYEKNKGRFNIQGFRKGKAPKRVIEQQYGEGVFFDDALDTVFAEEYYSFLQKETDVEPINNPDIKIEKFDENGLVISAEVEVTPEFKLGQYKGLEIEKNKAKIKASDVSNELEKARQKSARFVETEDAAALGDFVEIDFSGSVNGTKFEGGTATNYRLELGSKSFIDNFEDQLVGLKKGDEKVVNVKFPDEYPASDLAGKNADFEVKVNKVEKKILPELDDAFASNASEFETLEDFKADIKNKLEKELAQKIDREFENAIIEKIVNSTDISLPEILKERELDNIMKDLEMRLSYQGLKLDDYAKYTNTTIEKIRADREKQAVESAKTRLVLERIIKNEKLFVTEKELDAKIDELASKYGKEEDKYKKFLREKQGRYLENEILMEKLFSFLKENNQSK